MSNTRIQEHPTKANSFMAYAMDWGKITFKDGAIYEGEWSFGHAEGTGTFQYMAGEVYKGGMLHNLKHGIGITTHLNKKRDEC